MCGFIGFFGSSPNLKISKDMQNGIKERGEVSEIFSDSKLHAIVRRLKIVDRENAIQPFLSDDRNYILIYNGEIFNYKDLRKKYLSDYNFKTNSDTETLMAMLLKFKDDAMDLLEGQFAFVLFNLKENCYFAGRDHIGISPLYYCQDNNGIYFSSTIKSLTSTNLKIKSLEPGHTLCSKNGKKRYFTYSRNIVSSTKDEVIKEVKEKITEAVKIRVDTDLPVGVIYSGGIDSTIVLHLAQKFHKKVTAFTIGKEGSEDFEISKKFCKERNIKQVIIPLDSNSLNLNSVKEGIKNTELTEYLDIINGVITLPLFKKINKSGIKVTLSGDGSDELFGGYDMYDKISSLDSKKLFQYKLEQLHRTELQRVDRAAGSYKIENRVPFLDKNLMETALKMENKWKIHNKTEKWCVRKAFEDELPQYILYRRKNPLSHSSGLHEAVRLNKIFFRNIYNSFKYNNHDELRRDFSITLIINNYSMEKATSNSEIYRDYSLKHKLLEFVKGFIRFYIFSPNLRRKPCIDGSV